MEQLSLNSWREHRKKDCVYSGILKFVISEGRRCRNRKMKSYDKPSVCAETMPPQSCSLKKKKAKNFKYVDIQSREHSTFVQKTETIAIMNIRKIYVL